MTKTKEQMKAETINLMDAIKADDAAGLTKKAAILNKVTDDLATIALLEADGHDKSKEAGRLAQGVADNLYILRRDGHMTADDVSSRLIETFGAKLRTDPKTGLKVPGKTPEGTGEHIRKRVVRGVQAAEYIRDPKTPCPVFLEGADLHAITENVAALDAGQINIWTAYDQLAALKGKAPSINPILDPTKVLKMATAILLPSNTGGIQRNPTLIRAYIALIDAITAATTVAAQPAEQEMAA